MRSSNNAKALACRGAHLNTLGCCALARQTLRSRCQLTLQQRNLRISLVQFCSQAVDLTRCPTSLHTVLSGIRVEGRGWRRGCGQALAAIVGTVHNPSHLISSSPNPSPERAVPL